MPCIVSIEMLIMPAMRDKNLRRANYARVVSIETSIMPAMGDKNV
jgi:hypothetical protein